jgi:hypothetical protein|tara:strand:- start:10 stop:240 length:231 start_codon:yes stop_codon:yes gene_type:complete
MKHLWFKLILFLMACDKSEPLDDACYLIPDPGVCLAAIPRYYYDQDSGNCKEFLWGGCGGVVPFETMEECKSGCNN